MVESQPGTVTTFDPSLILDGFSASTRDRFMFNENQLALAKVVRPLVSYAAGYSGNPVTQGGFQYFIPTYYYNYINSAGQYVYADDLFFLSDATGVPTDDVHGIVVGFDFQVSTDQIKFWSTTFIDTTYLSVDYSFDNLTWFSVGTVTWSYVFDDSLELFDGESPASGQYEITGDFATAAVARYWRLKSQGQATVVSSTSSVITVNSTVGWPSTGRLSTVSITSGEENRIKQSLTYTGKTSTTFTGLSGSTATPGMYVVLEEDLAPTLENVTELRIIQTTEPIIEHWNSDGSQAVSVIVEGSQFYDICYDKNDDVYYAIYFNEEPSQTDPIDASDNFNQAFSGSSFDPQKWIESETYPFFVHNTPSGTLDLVSSSGQGLLTGNYGLDGNFVANIEFVGAFTTNSGTAFSIAVEDYDTGNQYIVSTFKGAYAPPSVLDETYGGAVLTYTDTIGGAATLRNFRVAPHFFGFGTPGGSLDYTMVYNSTLNKYTVTSSGVSYPPATPGIPYTGMSSATFTISNVYTPADGQGFTVHVDCALAQGTGTLTSGIQIELERAGTNAYARYTDGTGEHTLLTGNIGTGRLRPFLYANPGPVTPNLRADNFSVTGGTVHFPTPVFTVVSINKDGEFAQVPSVTDSSGYAIRNFDIIRNPQAEYNDYIYPFVAIATNGAAEGSGGEIYIKLGETLYKYPKTVFPITHEDEDASTATVTTEGEIPEDGITAFSYNGFSQAGLSYIKYESSLDGVFLKTIKTTDLTASAYKVKLDLTNINYPFAWNVSDLATLYYVNDDALLLYDLNESKAAFVTVTSDKQVLAAGTGETAEITAQVLNVYGIPKSAKSMTFSVSAGDGAISPASGCSDVNGEDTTTYTVGSAVGTATITVTVSDITCV